MFWLATINANSFYTNDKPTPGNNTRCNYAAMVFIVVRKEDNYAISRVHLRSLSGSCTVTLLLRNHNKTFYNNQY